MTREEEFDWLCRLRSEIYVYMPKEWLIPMNNALDMAIEALEQEPVIEPLERLAESAYKTAKALERLDALDEIRAEIDRIEINGRVDEHTLFIRTGDQVKQMALDIIDKYRKEN